MDLPALHSKIEVPLISIVIKQEPVKPKPVLYTIKEGDSLTSIAKAQSVPLERIWAANPEIADPNLIEPEKPLKIPQANEQLAERPLPIPAPEPVQATQSVNPGGSTSTLQAVPAPKRDTSNSGGNTYSYGYCTWHVKNLRPDLPNNLGNADTWYINYNGSKGSTPAVGAVGVTKAYMHVVYITGVNGDGTVSVSEMNYAGWNVISSRVAPASEFLYIY